MYLYTIFITYYYCFISYMFIIPNKLKQILPSGLFMPILIGSARPFRSLNSPYWLVSDMETIDEVISLAVSS